MITKKFSRDFGYINSPENRVIVRGSKELFKDLAIGSGLIVAGIIYICASSFIHGAKAYEDAEYSVLKQLELVD